MSFGVAAERNLKERDKTRSMRSSWDFERERSMCVYILTCVCIHVCVCMRVYVRI